ncbi:MAG: diaminopimelate epimerase [Reichenbachiella sp.]
MASINFTKMQGCGNDYVYINCFEEQVENPTEFAKKVSNRNFGIGSDGLILIKPHQSADAEMVMYNSDGTVSEMCGNGLRCVAKYIYDYGICTNKELSLMTGAGLKTATITETKESQASLITIDMGPPILKGLDIPTAWDIETVVNTSIIAGDTKFLATCVSMGNPHCVIYVSDLKNFPIETYGPLIETADCFPNRINIEFVEIISHSEVYQRTWERGCGETLACGTGASAVCVAGILTGKTNSNLLIHLVGGDLTLSYEPGNSVIMTGPAEEVFSGSIR